MRIYVRKVFPHDITHEVSLTTEMVNDFFEKRTILTFIGENSKKVYNVTINNVTDPRFGGDFKSLLADEGGISVNDLIVTYKETNKFRLEVVRSTDKRYDVFHNMFNGKDRHLDFAYEEITKEHIDTNLVGTNKIYYGIPGCGKSYHIEYNVLKDVNKKDDVIRTTFYLDYSNSDFIGQIFPKVESEKISYEPIPGPFTKALEKALTSPNKMIYLVIEEINRGNAAAIFGDTFQLLDRLKEDKEDRVKGDSEYPISNEFIENYFEKRNIRFTRGKIIIPHNLTILATMNTSDQNVFPLDTAFKRRWDRERITTRWEEVSDIKDLCIPFTDITWKNFAENININMIQNAGSGLVTEDKKLGPYFANENMLVVRERRYDKTEDNKERLRRFMNNVLDYLYSDVAKFEPEVLFTKGLDYDQIYNTVIEFLEFDVNERECEHFIGIFRDKIEPDVIDELSKIQEG